MRLVVAEGSTLLREGLALILRNAGHEVTVVTDAQELHAAVEAVAAGGTVIDPDVVRRFLSRRRMQAPLERLSPGSERCSH